MGVLTVEKEYSSMVPRAKLFQFLTKDYYDLLPKVSKPIQSVEPVNGPQKKINYVIGGKKQSLLQEVEGVDEENFAYKYSIVQGSDFPEKVEKKTFEIKMLEAPDGGNVGKVTASIFYKGNVPPTDQELQPGEDYGFAVFKDIEAFLIAN
ncbi:putative START-like domain, Bet v I type allergen [Senna tora]|uniref:Putative START-like domain, Bet v I type allergen n=1 Tax=Senna tora TaxID=362788 RepID=A0A834WDS3_9FABA|nr:putative START-like domain, Bet v I type allergen [Senna tora]